MGRRKTPLAAALLHGTGSGGERGLGGEEGSEAWEGSGGGCRNPDREHCVGSGVLC